MNMKKSTASMANLDKNYNWDATAYFEQLVATVKDLAAEAGIDPSVINFEEMQ